VKFNISTFGYRGDVPEITNSSTMTSHRLHKVSAVGNKMKKKNMGNQKIFLENTKKFKKKKKKKRK